MKRSPVQFRLSAPQFLLNPKFYLMSENPSSNRENPEYGIKEWGNDRQSLGYRDAKIEEINANIIYQREHRMLCENDPSLDKEFSDSIITKST